MAENFINTLNQLLGNFKKECAEGAASGSATSWKDFIAIAQKNYDEAQKQAEKGNEDVLKQLKKADEDMIQKMKDSETSYTARIKGEYEKLLGMPKTPVNQPQVFIMLEALKKMLFDAFLLFLDPKSVTYINAIKFIQSFGSTANVDITQFYKEAMNLLEKGFTESLQKLKFY